MSSFGLYEFNESTNQQWDSRGRIARSLRSYYAGQQGVIADPELHELFMDHEDTLRTFGDTINARLASVPTPDNITALHSGVTGINNGKPDTGQQQLRAPDQQSISVHHREWTS